MCATLLARLSLCAQEVIIIAKKDLNRFKRFEIGSVFKLVIRRHVLKHFKPLYDRAERYIVYHGGRGSGKSWGIAQALLTLANSQSLRILCTREIQNSIRDSVHKLLWNQIYNLGFEKTFKVNYNGISCKNGHIKSEFIFMGLNKNEDKIKSMEGIDICWIEEGESISKLSWEMLDPTVRKDGSNIFISFNPRNETDIVYENFVKNPPDNAIVTELNWDRNPYFPEALMIQKNRMFERDPDNHDWIFGGGLRVVSDAQIFKGKFISKEFDPMGIGMPLYGLDFGFSSDPLAVVECYLHDEILYIHKELYGYHIELDDISSRAVSIMPGIEKKLITSDSSRPESISYLKRHGLPKIHGAKKWSGSIEDGIEYIRSLKRVVIHPRCEKTLEEFKLYCYKTEKDGTITTKIVDANNHCIDAIRYALVRHIQGYSSKVPKIYVPSTADRRSSMSRAKFAGY